jgi:shikimate kinase / 3-dehydroquinate synthase
VAPLVALVGFMGSGKSSVGGALAARLGWTFVDLDEEFARSAGVSISEFFATSGESAFRGRECAVLATVLSDTETTGGLVLSLGGGTLENAEAFRLLAERKGVVLLDVDVDEAWARAEGTGRPLAKDRETFAKLLERRRATYERAADWVFPVRGGSVESLAQEIATIVRSAGSRWEGLWGRRLAGTERDSLIVGGVDALHTLRERGAALLETGSRFFVVTDRNVMKAWGPHVLALLGGVEPEAVLVVTPGETSKSMDTLGRCWEWLAARGARRDDTVVALGGGVVGDLGGFAAATYQRGISLWQIPTSLLAQVDSSVGGKTAINLEAGKNLVGAFYQPDLSVIDPATLSTLPRREYAGGLGEVVKHALLMSPDALGLLEGMSEGVSERDPGVLSLVVKSNIAYKAGVVEKDEREKGVRAVLNLGHTTAHALEAVKGYGEIGHGEAVALGLLVSLAVSEDILGLDPSVRERTKALLEGFGLRTTITLPAADLLLAASARDKKVRAHSAGFVGLRSLGEPVWGLDVTREVLAQALEVIRE